jgi:hypothetical protein
MWNLLEDAADDPLTRRRAVQVAHSLNVITELPQYVEDAVFPVGLRSQPSMPSSSICGCSSSC